MLFLPCESRGLVLNYLSISTSHKAKPKKYKYILMAYIFGATEWKTILKLVACKRWKCEMTKAEKLRKKE